MSTFNQIPEVALRKVSSEAFNKYMIGTDRQTISYLDA